MTEPPPNLAPSFGRSPPLQSPASLGSRFGACLLDGLLVLVTLGIGWAIWSLCVWGKGQSPGKQLTGLRCVDTRTGATAGFGAMAMRELIGKGLLGTVTLGITSLIGIIQVFGTGRRTVWDHIGNTVVVSTAPVQRVSQASGQSPPMTFTPSPAPTPIETSAESPVVPIDLVPKSTGDPLGQLVHPVGTEEQSLAADRTISRQELASLGSDDRRLVIGWDVDVHLQPGDVVLVGRDPLCEDLPTSARAVRVPSDWTTVSKTHFAVHVGVDEVLVEDRHSQNGTQVHPAGGIRVSLRPGDRMPARAGTEIYFGDHRLRLE